jgi:hypothetical protein
MVCDVAPGKIPNMACQGFTGELSHKVVLLGRSSLGLLAT